MRQFDFHAARLDLRLFKHFLYRVDRAVGDAGAAGVDATFVRLVRLRRSDSAVGPSELPQLLSRQQTLGDAPATIETVARTETLARTLVDAPATSDTVASSQVLARTTSDVPNTSDTAADVQALLRAASDATSTSDAASRTETLARSLADAPATSDAVVAVVGGLSRTLTDAPSTSDTVADVQALARTLTDAPSTSDSVDAIGPPVPPPVPAVTPVAHGSGGGSGSGGRAQAYIPSDQYRHASQVTLAGLHSSPRCQLLGVTAVAHSEQTIRLPLLLAESSVEWLPASVGHVSGLVTSIPRVLVQARARLKPGIQRQYMALVDEDLAELLGDKYRMVDHDLADVLEMSNA